MPPEEAVEPDAGCATLCDSLHAAPVLLQHSEMFQLLSAAAFDGAAARSFNANGFNSEWGCFLAGIV